MEWSATKQQVFAFERDIVVSAGAGSGKTAALVELYLRLIAGETKLDRRLSVPEIVAITFTDKAALEMKERIREGMTGRLTAGDGAAAWEQELRALSAAPIATFHSFCARLLRENPAEAGVDPAFSLLDELAAWGEMRGALDEVIERELAASSPEIRLLLEQFPLSGAGRGKGLRDFLADMRRKRANCGGDFGEAARQADWWAAQAREVVTRLPGRIAVISGRLGVAIAEREGKGGKEPAYLAKMRSLAGLCTTGFPPGGEITPDSLEAMLECTKGTWGGEHAGLRGEVKELLESVQLAENQLQAGPSTAALLTLAEKLEQCYRSRKERRGVLDFDDLLVKTRDLLKEDGTIREEVRQRYPVVMVDEFQDTNLLQKELVELICGEEQRLFIVGDPKQSIYLFRGADVSVFGRAQAETVARGGENLYFQESFRSREGIVRFVNSLFGMVMGDGDRDAGTGERKAAGGEALCLPGRESGGFDVCYGTGDHLVAQRCDWDGTPCVELLALDGVDTSAGRRRAEAVAIARKIRRIVAFDEEILVYDKKAGNREPGTGTGGPQTSSPDSRTTDSESRIPDPETVFVPRKPRYGDIAILFRRFTHLKVFERELRRSGVPYYVVKGKGFYRCQEVLDLLNFLRWLDFSGDLAALAGLLRSPLCGISDETLYLLSRLDGGIAAWERAATQSVRPDTHMTTWDRIDPADRDKLVSLALLAGRLRPLRDRLTLAELMEEVLTGTDVTSSLLATFQGEQKAANLRKLIELSRSFTGEGEGGLRSFVAYLGELVETEPTEAEAVISAESEDVVRLMTVHQSKGLEFPVVFVPELGASPHADPAPVQYDDACGLGVKLARMGGARRPTLAGRAIADLRSRKEGAELKRLFYVAVTRARDYLVLSGEKGKGGGGTWREWVDDSIAGNAADFVKVNAAVVGTGERAAGSAGLTGTVQPGTFTDGGAFAAGVRRSLHFTPPLPSSMVFSPTSLEDYENCPRKYFYKAVMGLDEGLFAELLGRPAVRRNAGSGMTPLEKGDLAHLLLERADLGADRAALHAACLRIAAANVPEPGDKGVAEVVDTVTAFAASPLGLRLAKRRMLREHPFILRLTGAADYYIRGAMDLVLVEDDRVTVYDYKYLRKEDADLEGYRFQIRTYMLALSRAWPGRKVAGKLLFLRGGGEEEIESDLPLFEAHLIRIMDAIRERGREADFGLKPGCDGGHCPFRQRCRMGEG
jgi:ATP-dependent helicase/nuclease subunit A